MIVSWDWLKQYVELNMPEEELVDRLTMSGLNHEGSEHIFGDVAIDLEVTSNRPDCLGHIGVAREIATLFELPLNIPEAQPKTTGESVADHCSVEIQCPDLCQRYTARLLRGVKIGPSPDWLADRLKTIGIGIVNNVVDATNYVMFECGQPLHAFDLAKVDAGKIIVREAVEGEKLEAIDHKTYELRPGMCMICDPTGPSAIGGVMGGAESEVSDSTTDVLLEAAVFAPLSIRNTARALNLHSPSSFRFERSIDQEGLDWASRRCAELILETAGGELLEGVVDVGNPPPARKPIVLRLSELQRVLGIEIPAVFVPGTLTRLGLDVSETNSESVTSTPPSWRADLTREVDLVEEVGRIYGFDKVPDDAAVPMAASHKTKSDRVLEKVRNQLTAHGFDEAMTPSLVPEPWSEAFSPWSDGLPLISSQPMLGVLEKSMNNIGAVEFLRRSIVPSLVEAKRINEFRSNDEIELFETAKVYLSPDETELPEQPEKVGLVSGRDFFLVKAIVRDLVASLNPATKFTIEEFEDPFLELNQSAALHVNGRLLGYLGQVSEVAAKQFKIRSATIVAELDLGVLIELANLIPQHSEQSLFPAVSRDFNFIVDEAVRWSQLEKAVHEAGGELLEDVSYRETFRDESKDGADKKRLLLSVVLRSSNETLTSEQADDVCQAIVQNCEKVVDASLVL